MLGHQITFFTQQDRKQDGRPVAQWLLEQAAALGIRGATLSAGQQGLGHDGRLHAVNLFDYSDQPVQVTLIVGDDEEQRLFTHLRASGVQVFYIRCAVEFGTLGSPADAAHTKEDKS